MNKILSLTLLILLLFSSQSYAKDMKLEAMEKEIAVVSEQLLEAGYDDKLSEDELEKSLENISDENGEKILALMDKRQALESKKNAYILKGLKNRQAELVSEIKEKIENNN